MAWYDSIVNSITTVPDRLGALASEYLDAEGDRIGEEIRDPVTDKEIKQPETAAKTFADNQNIFGQVTWQKAGVVLAGAGVLLTVYKLVK